MAAPVLLPTGLVTLHAERFFLAEAHRAHTVGANSLGNKELLHCCCAPITERKVIFRRPTLVAMAFNCHSGLRVVAQEVGCLGQGFACVGPQVSLVKVKVRIANFLIKKVHPTRGCRRRRSWRRRCRNRYPHTRISRAAWAARSDGI